MEIMPPGSASIPATLEEPSTYDEFSMQQSLLFSDSLNDLKNLRSQLYSAAEYFEVSYSNDDQKQIVMDTLKDYAVKALVNTVDHLGTVSYKVNGLIDEKVDEVSETDIRVSCIEQRLRTCQQCIDLSSLSQQSLIFNTPKYHKRYILPVGEPLPGSGKDALPHDPESQLQKTDHESQLFQENVRAILTARMPSFRKGRSGRFSSPSLRARSSSPSRRSCSPSPSPRLGMVHFRETRSSSTAPSSNPSILSRSGSVIIRPALFNSSSVVQQSTQFPTESYKSYYDGNDQKEPGKTRSKATSFLRSLIGKRKMKKDDMLYTYLDEY